MIIVTLVDYSVTTIEHLAGASSLRWASSAQFTDGETEVRRGAGTRPKSHTQKLELGFRVWSVSAATLPSPGGPVMELSPREAALGWEHYS